MTDHNHTATDEHLGNSSPADTHLENFGEEVKEKDNDVVAKAATIAVVGVGVALISAELIPGMLIGVAAAFLPGFGKKLRPLFKSTVRAGYTAIQKTREMVAEATEQVQDVMAEARADHASKAEAAPAASRTTAA